MTDTNWASDAAGTGQYAEVNGINLYYETHGAGRPLILLHGGLGSGEMFGPVLPALAARHQVIAVDLQGHRRTADIDRPLDVRLMADDIGALIGRLQLDKPDVAGYSLGGGVALQTAAMYPALVGRLVVVSANVPRDAIYPEMLAQQGQVSAAAAEIMKDTPMYQLSTSGSPRARGLSPAPGQDRRGDVQRFRLHRGGARPADADAHRRRRRRHGAAQPLRRGLQPARRRTP